MSGREVPIVWRGRAATAFVPDPLALFDHEPTAPLARRLERAAAALRRADEHLPADVLPLLRLLLRTEGLASSQIEGVRAPVGDVAAAELAPTPGTVAAHVAGNLNAVVTAIRDPGRLTVGRLDAWHALLMRDSPLAPEHVGAVRTAQSWVGGVSPLDAALVPPPAELVPGLLDDLVAFAERDDIDPVVQAAVAHVQFESIHPYADGNGRLGRVLLARVLARRLGLRNAPPVSVQISADRGGYLSGMTLWRLGTPEPWLSWCAEVVELSGTSSYALMDRLAALRRSWRDSLSAVRSDAAAWPLLDLLAAQPVLTAPLVAERLGISLVTARSALQLLHDREIVASYVPQHAGRPGRPARWWASPQVLALVADGSH